MNNHFFAFLESRFAHLNTILDDVLRICEMDDSAERTALVRSIKDRTNHAGLHITTTELYILFLGRVSA